jgi:hypothetical protein
MMRPTDETRDLRARFRMALENNTDWGSYRTDITLNHLIAALTSAQGAFILCELHKITCGTWASTGELFLHAEVTLLVGPTFETKRSGTFTFKTEGRKFRGLLTPAKPSPNESNHRDKTCQRKRMRHEGRKIKVNINHLFR